jgi:hypothetical protein
MHKSARHPWRDGGPNFANIQSDGCRVASGSPAEIRFADQSLAETYRFIRCQVQRVVELVVRSRYRAVDFDVVQMQIHRPGGVGLSAHTPSRCGNSTLLVEYRFQWKLDVFGWRPARLIRPIETPGVALAHLAPGGALNGPDAVITARRRGSC